jgi:hypothetical protein
MVSIVDSIAEPAAEFAAPPAELDDEHAEEVTEIAQAADPVIVPTALKVSAPPPADPFAEEFDEEEVVIDNFAAWDDMFRRETPRVENRRDPEFATFVQAAIDHAPPGPATADRNTCDSPTPSFNDKLDQLQQSGLFAFHDDAALDQSIDSPFEDEAELALNEWQPLRLAVLSDPVPLRPIPLVAAASRSDQLSRGAPLVTDALSSEDWPDRSVYSSTGAMFSAGFENARSGRGAVADDPVLVVEEDAPVNTLGDSQVRQDDYRHLFSRLHGG